MTRLGNVPFCSHFEKKIKNSLFAIKRLIIMDINCSRLEHFVPLGNKQAKQLFQIFFEYLFFKELK